MRYGKWAGVTDDTSPVKSWRVESDRFTIRCTLRGRSTKLSNNKFEVRNENGGLHIVPAHEVRFRIKL